MIMSLRVDTLNCRGLNDTRKRKNVFAHFHKVGADIVLLQETHSTRKSAKRFSHEWKMMSSKHHSAWNSLTNFSCGVGILLADSSHTKLLDMKSDMNGRVLTLKLECLGHVYQVQSVYAPTAPEARPQFFENLDRFVFPDATLIAGGDWNMVENTQMDRLGGTLPGAHARGLAELSSFKTGQRISDIWRTENPGQVVYTWSSPNNQIHSRIDRFYIAKDLQTSYIQQTHTHNPWSDHRTVTISVELKAKSAPRGSGHWKLNVDLLQDVEYRETIRDLIREWLLRKPLYDAVQVWWRDFKIAVKLVTVELAVRRSRERRDKIRILTKFVDKENQKNTPDKQYITNTLEEIAELKDYKHRGAMIRSREKLIVDGEKPTKYFYAQERMKKIKSTILRLRAKRHARNTRDDLHQGGLDVGSNEPPPCNRKAHHNGGLSNPEGSFPNQIDGTSSATECGTSPRQGRLDVGRHQPPPCNRQAGTGGLSNPEGGSPTHVQETVVVTEPDDILDEVHQYYTELFRKRELDTNLQDELLQSVTKKLPPRQRMSMEKRITDKELEIATKAFNTDRSPGLDGIPIEFYLEFWDVLKEPFRELANDFLFNHIDEGSQQRISLITLLHKRNDKEDLDNWRPISLLCVDYKIVSKVLSLRLKLVLPHIIEEDQTCGILGRSIFENLYIIRDMIQYTNDHGIPAYLLSIDFKKAFDSVDHDFLEKALVAFGFGPVYTSFIISTLKNSHALAMNGGRFSRSIDLMRGVKQGDQESMQLYDIVGEVLAIQIRRNPLIRGIRLPSRAQELKLSLYADDNNNFCSTQQSIVHLFNELKRFDKATGCSINEDKTKGLLLGGAHRPILNESIEWNPPEGLKILGVRFFVDPMMTQTVTWNEIGSKIKSRAELLSARSLTMKGRATLANALLLSKAWHVATVIPAPRTIISSINTTTFNYIYNGKQPHTIAWNELTLRVPQGGIGLLDVHLQQQALRLNRLQHILDPTQAHTWLIIPRIYTAQTIARHNEEWRFLDTFPHIDFEDRFNDHIATPPHLQELSTFLRSHKERYIQLKEKSTHTIYQHLLTVRRSTLTITGERKWNRALGRQLNWAKIWKTNYQALMTSKHLDTWFLFLHYALPTGERTNRVRGRYATQCPRCGVYETTLHVFWECDIASSLWNRYHHVYTQLHGRQNLLFTEALFPSTLPAHQHKARLLRTVSGIIIHELWRARCVHRHDHIPADLETCTANINARIVRTHNAYIATQPDFEKKLCLPSPLCYMAPDGQIVFTLPQVAANRASDAESGSDVYTDSSSSS